MLYGNHIIIPIFKWLFIEYRCQCEILTNHNPTIGYCEPCTGWRVTTHCFRGESVVTARCFFVRCDACGIPKVDGCRNHPKVRVTMGRQVPLRGERGHWSIAVDAQLHPCYTFLLLYLLAVRPSHCRSLLVTALCRITCHMCQYFIAARRWHTLFTLRQRSPSSL